MNGIFPGRTDKCRLWKPLSVSRSRPAMPGCLINWLVRMTDSCLVLQISVSASFPEDTTGRSAGRCEKQEGSINCQETAPRNIQRVRGEHLGNNSLLLLALKPVVQYRACRGRAVWTGERKQSLYRVNCTIYKYSAGEGAAGVNYCSVCLVPKHSGIQDGIGVSVIAKTQADTRGYWSIC